MGAIDHTLLGVLSLSLSTRSSDPQLINFGSVCGERLRAKDLSALLASMGQPLSGTKPILKDRIVTHLTSILHKIDRLGSVEKGDSVTQSRMPSKKGRRLITPRQQQEERSCLQRIQNSVLPRSIVSIDIGIRNLAWVELSKDGEIIRWSVEDLLSVASPEGTAGSEMAEQVGTGGGDVQGPDDDIDILEGQGTSAIKRVRTASKKTKAEALPFDTQSVALRLDSVMRKIVYGDNSGLGQKVPSIQAVIIEKQRFRSGGIEAVLDATFRCGVIEGMIHTWLAVCQQDMKYWQRQNGMPTSPQTVEMGTIDQETIFVGAISPRAVAQWWGIGVTTSPKAEESNSCGSTMLPRPESLHQETTMKKIRQVEELAAKPKSPLYNAYPKKVRSKMLVAHWLQQIEDDAENAHSEHRNGFRIRCTKEMKDWYFCQKKKDDLSDCLLQAVAWFQWQMRAVQEAVERSKVGHHPTLEMTKRVSRTKGTSASD